MALRLQGKLALVTAAGQGIGRAIAERFAAEGARLIATDLEGKKLEGIKSLKRHKLDVRSTASIEMLANDIATELGALDVLVNCAGYVHHGSVLDCSEQDWDFSFDLNKGTANMLISDAELAQRRAALEKQGGYKYPASQTPWQEIQRDMVEQLAQGMVLRPAVKYHRIAQTSVPRDNH